MKYSVVIATFNRCQDLRDTLASLSALHPDGAWEVTAKITAEVTENYHQAGLRLYSDDENWASVHLISAGGNRQFGTGKAS